MNTISIRPATINDVNMVAKVHVQAWRETYADLMPASILDGLSVNRRAESWRSVLDDAHSLQEKTEAFVAVDQSHHIIGFGSCGRQRSMELDKGRFDSEVQAIYVLAEAQCRGIGKRLMAIMASHLQRQGYHGTSLWVLRENHLARRFYEALGGQLVGEREDRRGEHLTLFEVAYGWPDLRVMGAWIEEILPDNGFFIGQG